MAQTPKIVFVNVSASQTDSSIILAVPGKTLTIVSAFLVAGGTATDVTFKSKIGSASSVAITCLIANGANGGAVLSYNEQGWFSTESGGALVVTTGSGSTVGIQLNYLEI